MQIDVITEPIYIEMSGNHYCIEYLYTTCFAGLLDTTNNLTKFLEYNKVVPDESNANVDDTNTTRVLFYFNSLPIVSSNSYIETVILSFSGVNSYNLDLYFNCYLGHFLPSNSVYSSNYIRVRLTANGSTEIIPFFYGSFYDTNHNDSPDYNIVNIAEDYIWAIGPGILSYNTFITMPWHLDIYKNAKNVSHVFTFKYINGEYYLIRSSLPIYYIENEYTYKLINANNPISLKTLLEYKCGNILYIKKDDTSVYKSVKPLCYPLYELTEDDIFSGRYDSFGYSYPWILKTVEDQSDILINEK